ncbi:MAG: Hsp20/alpha crystallin family protein [Candidatus Omnitrophica bacterium]|nr:Hsp20/alpha crystallin family protein [Candidatus Omnitrophota bacterium]
MSKDITTTSSDTSLLPQSVEKKDLSTREDSRYVAPPVDIYENSDGLTIVADLPGVAKESVNVRVDNGILTLECPCSYEISENTVHHEFDLATFYRQFQLADEVDQERISADLKYGVLTIQLPKAEKTKPKKIEVKVVS